MMTIAVPKVLFVSHQERNCGVHQFGCAVYQALEGSRLFRFSYRECSSPAGFLGAVADVAPDVVLYNWHPLTLPWLTGPLIWNTGRPGVAIAHEMTSASADAATDDMFDFFITPDPTLATSNDVVFSTGRLVPEYRSPAQPPARPTIGSFGFATPGKGFEHIVEAAQREFDDCVIRLHMPPNHFFDPDGKKARHMADRCRSLIMKPGVALSVQHDFLDSTADVIDFLAGNHLNAFFYETAGDRGISSVIDLALAARRPIAVRMSSMFRHLAACEPSVFIEDSSLAEILRNGFAPLAQYTAQWNAEGVRRDYERALQRVLSLGVRRSRFDRSMRAASARVKSRIAAGYRRVRTAVAAS